MRNRKYRWQLVVGVLIGAAVLAAPQAGRAQVDDTGFVPPDSTTLKCESAVAKNVGKLRSCAEKCHMQAAAAALAGKPFDEEACEKLDAAKSCRAKFDASTAALTGCQACTDTALLADEMEGGLDRGSLFCAGSVHLGGDEFGFVPPDTATLKCENGVAASISKLEQCIDKCHIKAAAAAFAGKTFDEEACENDPAKSCRASYAASVAKLVGCPACLDPTHQASLAVTAESVLDSGRGDIYCAGTTPL